MRNRITFLSFLLFFSCQDFGRLRFVADLPYHLNEISGITTVPQSDLFWMVNDSGNDPILFGINSQGEIQREIFIDAENVDWEDLTSDPEGNIYIGDFGNNNNDRKELRILKIQNKTLDNKVAKVEVIEFNYENQEKYPPKKKEYFFDAESFFYYNNHLYILTKSRVDKKYGETNLYRIPAKKGSYKAELLDHFNNGKKIDSWITSAAISKDGQKVALLSQKNVVIFSDFKEDNFFKGSSKEIKLNYHSQLESLTFLDNNTLLLADERVKWHGGNLYMLSLENE